MINAIKPEATMMVFMMDNNVRLLIRNVYIELVEKRFKQYFVGGKINRKCQMKVLNLGRFELLKKSYIAIFHFKSATFDIKFHDVSCKPSTLWRILHATYIMRYMICDIACVTYDMRYKRCYRCYM